MNRPLILLVDDAPELGEIVTYLNRRLSLDTETRLDVPTAWHFLLTGRRPDLLLVDINLPGVSGIELCRRLRREPAFADLTVALFTSWSLPDNIAAGVAAGADHVVSKELVASHPEWQERLLEILGGRDGQGERPAVTWLRRDTPLVLPQRWVEALNLALRQSVLRATGLEVLRVILHRTLQRVLKPVPTAADLARLVSLDGRLSLSPSPPLAVETVERLLLALADQVWCLLGTDDSRAFRDALAAYFPDRFTPFQP